jgi:hypothetical protein
MINTAAYLTKCDAQLYAQASGVDFFLKSKAKEWAMSSAGLFPAAAGCPSRFLAWADIAGTAQENHVDWAPLKSAARAMQKLHRVHNGDVSLLLDLSRQMIVFEQVGDKLFVRFYVYVLSLCVCVFVCLTFASVCVCVCVCLLDLK